MGLILPILGPNESAESWIRRALPQLRQFGDGGNATTASYVYDSQGREVAGPNGLFAYVGSRLVIAPNIVQIDTEDLVDAAIETAKLGDGAVTGAKILDATIGTAKIANAAIVSALIADLAVVSAKIADLAVNNAKIANMDVGKLLAGTIGTNGIYIGDNKVEINGITGRLTVKDAAGYVRVEIGALAGGGYGLVLRDGSGNVILSSGSTSYLSGTYIDSLSADIITAGTMTSRTVRTASSGKRVEVSAATNTVVAYSSGGSTIATMGGEGSDGYSLGGSGTSSNPIGYLNNNGGGGALFASSSGGGAITALSFATQAIYGEASGSSAAHHGVYGKGGNNASAAGVLGVSGSGGIGCYGIGSGYDFYAGGSGTNYGPFTGAHDALWPFGVDDPEPGDIVVDVAVVSRDGVSNSIATVALSAAPNQPAAIGVFTGYARRFHLDTAPRALARTVTDIDLLTGEFVNVREWVSEDAEGYADTHSAIIVNAVGEGLINVCGEGGDIAPGDFIVTSSIPGKGMKSPDGIYRNTTVAKAREGATFSGPADERQIACIYLCG